MAKTTKNLFDDGYTTHSENGTTYRTTKETMGDGYITHKEDGTTYRTTKVIMGDGYITHKENGTTYRTTKDIVGDGYTTHGTDGSTYKTTKRLLGEGYSTNKISGPYRAGRAASSEGVGDSIGSFVILLIIAGICASILTPMSYIWIVAVMIAPRFSGLCERYKISRIWCSGPVFCYAAFALINSVFNDAMSVAYTRRGLEGLMVIVILLVILLLGLLFAIFELGESGTGYLAAFITIVSIAWCYLSGIHYIPKR